MTSSYQHEQDTPFFSVVLPTYNRASMLPDAVERVASLSFESFELIVVNDGSTDGTEGFLDRLSHPKVRVMHRENGGISAARNTGAENSRGRYIVPLDDDDLPESDWLDVLHDVAAVASASVVSCGCFGVDAATGDVIAHHQPAPLGPVFGDYTGLFLAGTFAVERSVFRAIGGFAEGLQCSHQTEFALRMLRYCRIHDLTVASTERELIGIVRRGATDRPESSPSKLLSGTAYLLEQHWDQLALQPSTLANYHAIAGVNAIKLGDGELGRRYLMKAWRLAPRSLTHARRAGLSLLPPLARSVWQHSD